MRARRAEVEARVPPGVPKSRLVNAYWCGAGELAEGSELHGRSDVEMVQIVAIIAIIAAIAIPNLISARLNANESTAKHTHPTCTRVGSATAPGCRTYPLLRTAVAAQGRLTLWCQRPSSNFHPLHRAFRPYFKLLKVDTEDGQLRKSVP